VLWKKISSRWDQTPRVQAQDEPDQHELLETVIETVAGERYQHISLGTPTSPNGPVKAMEYLGVAFMLVLLIGPSLALIATSIVSAGLATSSVGLSSNPKCGDYDFQFDSNSYSEPFLQYERQAEGQASEYAAKCYGSSSIDPDCNRFYRQDITYSKNESAKCPFNGDVCGTQAFSLTTGLVSGALLGINAANPFFFIRTMTCAPMITGKEYVKTGLSDRGQRQWEYWYGRSLALYTWAHPSQDSAWEIKGYSTGYVGPIRDKIIVVLTTF
jgi:hypothetical protein